MKCFGSSDEIRVREFGLSPSSWLVNIEKELEKYIPYHTAYLCELYAKPRVASLAVLSTGRKKLARKVGFFSPRTVAAVFQDLNSAHSEQRHTK